MVLRATSASLEALGVYSLKEQKKSKIHTPAKASGGAMHKDIWDVLLWGPSLLLPFKVPLLHHRALKSSPTWGHLLVFLFPGNDKMGPSGSASGFRV